MSLKPHSPSVPEQTVLVARASFPKGNPYLMLRDAFGSIFTDEDFADLYPRRGQPGYPPWRLALVTIMQFRENLSDRQAVEAVRGRIDWKYLLGLELTDPGFDDSVLSEFRKRLLEGEAESRLLDHLLTRIQEMGLLKERGKQRSDSTHVLASVRELNRLEHVAETLRAALNAIAELTPGWLRSIAPKVWFDRYSKRIEDSKLPRGKVKREAYLLQVAEDGFELLDQLSSAPEEVLALRQVAYLKRVWAWYFVREKPSDGPNKDNLVIRKKEKEELGPVGERPASPYDEEARYGFKRSNLWVGYKVHVSESCDDGRPRFITNVITKVASSHDAYAAPWIHEALQKKHLLPGEHLVDAAYISAKVLLESLNTYDVKVVGPTKQNSSWQKRQQDTYGTDRFVIDWDRKQIRCPEGKVSEAWGEYETKKMGQFVRARFPAEQCQACGVKTKCIRSETRGRQITIKWKEAYHALEKMRRETESEKGRANYAKRAGIEGTISQAVRGFGMRRSRYRSLAKTQLQHIATAAAINIDRFFAWQKNIPLAKTRRSHFARLAYLN